MSGGKNMKALKAMGLEAGSLLENACKPGKAGCVGRGEFNMFWDQCRNPRKAADMLASLLGKIKDCGDQKHMFGVSVEKLITGAAFLALLVPFERRSAKLKNFLKSWEHKDGSTNALLRDYPSVKEVMRFIKDVIEGKNCAYSLVVFFSMTLMPLPECAKLFAYHKYPTLREGSEVWGRGSTDFLIDPVSSNVANSDVTEASSGHTVFLYQFLQRNLLSSTKPDDFLLRIVTTLVTLPQPFKVSPKMAEVAFFGLVHLLRASMGYIGNAPASVLKRLYTTLQPYYLWPSPYGGAVREILPFLTVLMRAPLAAVESRLLADAVAIPFEFPEDEQKSGDEDTVSPPDAGWGHVPSLYYLYDRRSDEGRTFAQVLKLHKGESQSSPPVTGTLSPTAMNALLVGATHLFAEDGLDKLEVEAFRDLPATFVAELFAAYQKLVVDAAGYSDDGRNDAYRRLFTSIKKRVVEYADALEGGDSDEEASDDDSPTDVKSTAPSEPPPGAMSNPDVKKHFGGERAGLPLDTTASRLPTATPSAHLDRSGPALYKITPYTREEMQQRNLNQLPFPESAFNKTVASAREVKFDIPSTRQSPARTTLSLPTKLSARFVVGGGSGVLNHALTAYLNALQNGDTAHIDYCFLLVPFSYNPLASYLAQRDAWYRRHVFQPFRYKLAVLPWMTSNEEQKRSAGFSADLKHITAPTSFYRQVIENYQRDAAQSLDVAVYKAEVWFKGGAMQSNGQTADKPCDTWIPFCTSLDIGYTAAAVKHQSSSNNAPKRLAAVTSDRAFRFEAPQVSISIVPVDAKGNPIPLPTGNSKSGGDRKEPDGPLSIQSLSLSNVPRDGDAAQQHVPQPTSVALEMVLKVDKRSKSKDKNHFLVANPAHHVGVVNVVSMQPGVGFDLVIDGLVVKSGSPVERVRISPLTQSELRFKKESSRQSDTIIDERWLKAAVGRQDLVTFPVATFMPV